MSTGSCYVSLTYPTTGAGGEDVSRTTEWTRSMPKRAGKTGAEKKAKGAKASRAKAARRQTRARAKALAGNADMSKSRAASSTRRRRSNGRGTRSSKRAAGPKAPARPVSEGSEPSKAAADSKEPKSRRFLPEVLDRTVIAIPLLAWFNDPTKPATLRHRRRSEPELSRRPQGGAQGRAGQDQRRSSRRERTTGRKTRMSRIGGRQGHAGRKRAVRLCDARREGDQGPRPARQRAPPEKTAPSITSGRTFR